VGFSPPRKARSKGAHAFVHIRVYVHTSICVYIFVHIRAKEPCIYTANNYGSLWGIRHYRVAKMHRLPYKLQVISRKRATNSRALLQKMTCKDKASYGSSPPCTQSGGHTRIAKPRETSLYFCKRALHIRRGGGLGSRPKKMYGERLGDGVEYHLMEPTPRR